MAKSALGSFITIPGCENWTTHQLVKRLMKGIFNSRPPKPRYTVTWDIGVVIDYLRSLNKNENLSFKFLTLKLTTLLSILSHSRVHYLHSLSVDSMDLHDTQCTFFPTTLLKHSRPSFPGEPLVFYNYPADDSLCIITTLKHYLEKRNLLTNEKQLLITYKKPHHPAHRDTIARWLKTVLHLSGIDTKLFHAHSFRSASSSKASASSIPLADILRHGQWMTEKTWRKHYHKSLPAETDINYAEQLLQ